MKIALVKLSGKMIDGLSASDSWVNSLRRLYDHFDGIILVHGAGNIISQWCSALDIPQKFVGGQRRTCAKTMEVVAAVQSGLINATLVNILLSHDFSALGLTGQDRNLFKAVSADRELGYVGNPIAHKSSDWICNLLNDAVIPVFSSMCRSESGKLLNVNADVFAQSLAALVRAEAVFFVSDVQGVLLADSLCPMLTTAMIDKFIENGTVSGGMIPKLRSCAALLKNGIRKVWIGNGIEHIDYVQQTGGTWIVD